MALQRIDSADGYQVGHRPRRWRDRSPVPARHARHCLPRRRPDLRKIKQLIGYDPTLNLDDILTQVIEYGQKHWIASNKRDVQPRAEDDRRA